MLLLGRGEKWEVGRVLGGGREGGGRKEGMWNEEEKSVWGRKGGIGMPNEQERQEGKGKIRKIKIEKNKRKLK